MIEILLALLAGVLTVAAPCILPVLPIILGTSIGQQSRWRPFFIALGFVVTFAGFIMLFAVFNNLLGLDSSVLRYIAIVLLLLFGGSLLFTGLLSKITAKFESITSRILASNNRGPGGGERSGFLLGAALGVAWTPCAGPILGSILALVATQSDLTRAGILLVAYAIGAGVPMLAIAYGGQYVSTKVRVIARHSVILQKIFGILILAFAIAMIFDYDILIQAKLLEQWYPGGQIWL